METRLSSKNRSKNAINPINQLTREKLYEFSEDEKDPYPDLSATTQAKLKAWKGAEILSENPFHLRFPSDEVFWLFQKMMILVFAFVGLIIFQRM